MKTRANVIPIHTTMNANKDGNKDDTAIMLASSPAAFSKATTAAAAAAGLDAKEKADDDASSISKTSSVETTPRTSKAPSAIPTIHTTQNNNKMANTHISQGEDSLKTHPVRLISSALAELS